MSKHTLINIKYCYNEQDILEGIDDPGEPFSENGDCLGFINDFPEFVYPDRVACGILKKYFAYPVYAKEGEYFDTIDECKEWIKKQHKNGYHKVFTCFR